MGWTWKLLNLGENTFAKDLRQGVKFSSFQNGSDLPPRKLTWQWKIHHLKMYFLLNMGIFQCHVSFQGCRWFLLQLIHFYNSLGEGWWSALNLGRNKMLRKTRRSEIVPKNLCYQQKTHGCFLKWWYPTTMGFPTKNDHFVAFWGYHHLRNHPHDVRMLGR